METVRLALALAMTANVTSRDRDRLCGVNPEEIESDLARGAKGLSGRLGRTVGPVDWRGVDRQLELAERACATGLTRWDAHYPPRLAVIPDAPPLVFVRGDPARMDAPALAVVGTRAPSARGVAFATQLSTALAASGVAVVSGLARGIDTAAHRGALVANGTTIAVLGTGIDIVYPPENDRLMDEIASTGCVVSEQLCGTPGASYVFPRRNRIISGLSEAVVVVEGGLRSGALITARWALEQGRDVGAVPGFPGDFRSAGPNRLLRDGAFLVEDAVDVFLSVPSLRVVADVPTSSSAAGAPPTRLDRDHERVLGLATSDADIDDIAAASGMDVGRVQEILSRLEIDGRVVRDGLGRFVRAPHRRIAESDP
jgi:DNA processing protein